MSKVFRAKTVELSGGGPYDGFRLKIPADVFVCLYPRDSTSNWSYVDAGLAEGTEDRVYGEDGIAHLFVYLGVVVFGTAAPSGRKPRGR